MTRCEAPRRAGPRACHCGSASEKSWSSSWASWGHGATAGQPASCVRTGRCAAAAGETPEPATSAVEGGRHRRRRGRPPGGAGVEATGGPAQRCRRRRAPVAARCAPRRAARCRHGLQAVPCVGRRPVVAQAATVVCRGCSPPLALLWLLCRILAQLPAPGCAYPSRAAGAASLWRQQQSPPSRACALSESHDRNLCLFSYSIPIVRASIPRAGSITANSSYSGGRRCVAAFSNAL